MRSKGVGHLAAANKEPEQMNIFEKLAKIRKNVEVLQKNASGYGYKYVSEDVILEKITGLMDRYGLSLIPSIVPGSTHVSPYHYIETKAKKDGSTYDKQSNEVLVSADMVWTWINNAKPSDRIEVPWMMVGQQADASQAFGSGLSYASRYFLLKYFNCATTEDDPDNWRSRQKEAGLAEEREIAKEIVAKIHAKVTEFLKDHADQRDALTAAIKSTAVDKNGKVTANYMQIEDPAVASKTLKTLNDDFFHDESIAG